MQNYLTGEALRVKIYIGGKTQFYRGKTFPVKYEGYVDKVIKQLTNPHISRGCKAHDGAEINVWYRKQKAPKESRIRPWA